MPARFAALVLAAWAVASPAAAATLRVERDGSGEFMVIQEAVDAAAVGDTILVGPGHYSESTFVNGFHQNVWVTVDSLTIRGVEREQVIIGPEAGPVGWDTIGIGALEPKMVTIENLTIANAYHGTCIAGERQIVRGCRIRDGFAGVVSYALLETLVEDCVFDNNTDAAVQSSDIFNSTGVVVRDSYFWNNSGAIDLQTDGSLVQNCVIKSGLVGIQFSFGATGSVVGCDIQNVRNDGIVIIGGLVQLTANKIISAESGVALTVSGGRAEGLGNVFKAGGVHEAIVFFNQGTASLHEGHILQSNDALCVWTKSGSGNGHTIDLTNNYWGTADASAIAECIRDSQDFESLTGTVLFEPFHTQPVATEKQSMGSLKALFRRP